MANNSNDGCRPQPELLVQGAEARIYAHGFLNTVQAVTKERFAKTYRHAVLDARLVKMRMTREIRLLYRARTLGRVRTPRVLFVDDLCGSLVLERLVGFETVRSVWAAGGNGLGVDKQAAVGVAREIGEAMARLHHVDIIHGDLTTSNLLVRPRQAGGDEIAVIDFGLAFFSTLQEDKAVDLYVFERAMCSTHPKHADVLVREALDAYASRAAANQDSAEQSPVLRRLEEVRQRGRKRSMVG